MSQACVSVLNGDLINGRGERTVGNGELDRLRYFNFNHPYSFFSTLFTRNTYVYDRITGVVTISIPGFRPTVSLAYPLEITHFAISAIAIAADFDSNRYEHQITSLDEKIITKDLLPAEDIILQLPADSPHPVLLIMCVRFFEKADGRYYVRKDENVNAATIVEVFKP